MNTNEVALQWANMCKEGKNLECIEQLYADNVVCKEMPGMPGEITSGKQNIWNKSKEWLENMEAFHASSISEPVVAGNFFTAKMSFDCTFKDRGRQQMEEVCVYEVKEGKIVSEQYFYNI